MPRLRAVIATSAVLASLAAVLMAPTVAAARPAPHRCAGADALPTAGNATAARASVLCLLNRERRAHGLRSLRSDGRLRTAAERHSAHMARAHFFDHTTPAGTSMTDRIRSAGYTRNARSWSIGENIAWGTGALASPRAIVDSWMHSAGHRANILNGGYREIGVGIATGAPVRVASSAGGATFTTDFGARG